MRIILNNNATQEDIRLCNEKGINHVSAKILDYKSGS